jgi:uroporphyrinogen-III synthase
MFMRANTAPLAGVRVLVTRPAPSATNLCQQLQQLGATTVAIPALHIEALSAAADVTRISTVLQSLNQYDAIVFVSANAAAQFLLWIERCHVILPDVECFAIGSATADCVRPHFAQVHTPHEMHSEGLLALPVLQSVHHRRFLILRGQGGREYLGEVLRQRGAAVDYCELYCRTLPTGQQPALHSIAQQRGCDVWAASSGEAVQNLLTMAGESAAFFKHLPVVVPGVRVAAVAQNHGCEQVIQAQSATDNATIEAILGWHAG